MKIMIVYWSGTGNTEAMANAVFAGAKDAGADVELCNVSQVGDVSDCDVLLLGCPAMGNEELDPGEFEPFFAGIESSLSGTKIGLFGSYGWGDGEWMRIWQQRVESAGGIMIADGVTACGAPDSDALAACRALGEKAAK